MCIISAIPSTRVLAPRGESFQEDVLGRDSYTDCQKFCPIDTLLGGGRSPSLRVTQGRQIFVQGTSCHLSEAQTIQYELLATAIGSASGSGKRTPVRILPVPFALLFR